MSGAFPGGSAYRYHGDNSDQQSPETEIFQFRGTKHDVTIEAPFRPPFQGGAGFGLFPGLKPWAVLLDHFMVKSCHRP